MKNEIYSPHQASLLGADANMIALLAYLSSTIMGWIPVLKYVSFFAPLIIYFLEKDSLFVRFHSMQAFLLNVISNIVAAVYSAIMGVSIVGIGFGLKSIGTGLFSAGVALAVSFLVLAFSIVVLVYNIIAMIGAHHYKEYHIPIIGAFAASITGTDK